MDELEVKTTAGSAANIRLLSENYVQLAIAQEDMVEEASSGTEKNALQILQVNGISERMFEAVHLNYASAAQELKDGEIDAFFCTAGIQTTAIEELARQCEIRFLEVGEKEAEKLEKAYGAYETYEIPSDTYSGQKEEIHTVCVQAVLLANDRVSENTVKELTRLFFDKKEELFSIEGATTLCTAAATFGLIAGSVIGGTDPECRGIFRQIYDLYGRDQ